MARDSTPPPARGRLHRPVRRDARARPSTCATRCGASTRRRSRPVDAHGRPDRRRHGRLVGRRPARRRRVLGAAAAPPARARRGLRHPGLDRAARRSCCARATPAPPRRRSPTYDAAKAAGAPRIVATTGGPLAERARARRRAGRPAPGRLPAARRGRLLARRRARGRRAVRRRAVAARRGRGAPPRSPRAGRRVGPGGRRGLRGQARSRARCTARSPSSPAPGLTAAVAYRWKCQINENAELPAFASKLPEHDHNEIVGWAGARAARSSAVFLEDPEGARARRARALEVTAEIAGRRRRGRRAGDRARRVAARAARLARAARRPRLALPRRAARDRPGAHRGDRPLKAAPRRRARLIAAADAPGAGLRWRACPTPPRSIRTAASLDRRRGSAPTRPAAACTSTNPPNARRRRRRGRCSADADGVRRRLRAPRAPRRRRWAAVPAPARGRVIAQVGRLVEANKEALARLVTREIGKPYPEALGEVQEIIDTCDFFLGEGRRLYGQTVPSEMPDKQLFTFRMPVGVAAIITAGNFPGRRAVLVPRAGDPVRQRGRLEAGRVLRRDRRRAGADLPRRRRARRACSTSSTPTAPRRSRASSARSSERLVDKVGFTGLERGRRRRSASCAAATCSRRAWSSAARTRWS